VWGDSSRFFNGRRGIPGGFGGKKRKLRATAGESGKKGGGITLEMSCVKMKSDLGGTRGRGG